MIKRNIIFGDIHGCCKSLTALLEKIKPEVGKDRLIFLGDLFDRGPDSLDVYITVQKLADHFGDDFVLLMGNHEDYLLQPKLTKQQRTVWERVGRQATVMSFRNAGMQMEDTIPWLQEHVLLFWRNDRFQCVHAGALIEPLEANDHFTLIHDHGIVMENRYSGKLTVTGHIALPSVTWFSGDEKTNEMFEEEKTYVLPEKGIICIDTGSGKGGKLTAMIIEGNGFYLLSTRMD